MSITIGIGKNLKVTPTPTPTANEPEVDAYILGLTTELSAEQIAKLNTFVYCLKNSMGITALSSIFDVLYIFAGETKESSLRNLIKRDFDATEVNAPTWTQYEGFTGDGLGKYLNANFQDSDGNVFDVASYDYMMGGYVRSGSYGNLSIIGSRNTPGFYHMIYNHALNDLYYFAHANSTIKNYANISYPRLSSCGRNSDVNNSIGYLKNKTVSGNDSDASVFNSIGTHDYFILASNNRGTGPLSLFNGQISMAYFSKFLTEANNNVLWNCFLAYMNANGKDT